MIETYPDKVKIVFKNFPLRSHPFAFKAATAALAADRQGKFWELHNLLFKNFNHLDDQKIQSLSLTAGLDQTAFQKDMTDPGIRQKIVQDVSEGNRIGVTGTPTVFVNGRRLGNWTLKGFKQAVDAELGRLGR